MTADPRQEVERVKTTWVVPPIVHDRTLNVTKKSVLEYTIDEASLLNDQDKTSPYTSLCVFAEELPPIAGKSKDKRQFFYCSGPGFWEKLVSPSHLKWHKKEGFSIATPAYLHEVVPTRHSVPLYIDIDIPLIIYDDINDPDYVPDAIVANWIKLLDLKVKQFLDFVLSTLEKTLGVKKCFTIGWKAHKTPVQSEDGTCLKGKYSVHLITHLNGAQTRFRCSQDLYMYLDQITTSEDPDIKRLVTYSPYDFVYPTSNQGEKPTLLFDVTIYRANGGMRLPYSSKRAEPKRALVPSFLQGIDVETLRELYPNTKTHEERLFLASVVTYVSPKVTVTEFLAHPRVTRSLKRPLAISNAILLGNKNPVELNRDAPATMDIPNDRDVNPEVEDEKFVDLLVEDIQSRVPEEARAPLYLLRSYPYMLIFASTGTWCTVRGAFHKSNHTFWVAMLKSGKFYQRCFDEDCIRTTVARANRPGAEEDPHLIHHGPKEQSTKGKFYFVNKALWGPLEAFLTRKKEVFDKFAEEARKASLEDNASEPAHKKPRHETIAPIFNFNANRMWGSAANNIHNTVAMGVYNETAISARAIKEILASEVDALMPG